MNWLDPQAVREWLAGPLRCQEDMPFAWEQFGLAVAALDDVEVHNEADSSKCAACQSVAAVRVARIIRDAQEGK